ncbi:hypothetical protein ABL78_0197 [Leptomonas seymouri]|uniref:C3H1-type domain-containing protein n=1 Tax=Leptomonas seymouri TaxID=5684 RepID=A0A0N1I468_LEPSE|nr:hypothetical protein ABL78_0197 [Leptomonas seymouri]|eukprot:KPI90761.1 hypothetical protein ABL78_0197 [Leptomonas seymouri]
MSQFVYVQSIPSETMQYYTAELVHRPPMQQMTILCPAASSSSGMHLIATPAQPQQSQQQTALNGSAYCNYQSRPTEMNNKGKVAYLVLSANPPGNAGPMSVFIQSNNPSCPTLSINQSHGGPEMYATAQIMAPQHQQSQQQHQMMTYMPMPSQVAVTKPTQPMIDPSTKLALQCSSEVCRHYLNGRCNRRKCRFLHPDLHHPVESTVMTYLAPAEPNTPVLSRTSQSGASIAPYVSSPSSSMSSFTFAGAPVPWSGQRA